MKIDIGNQDFESFIHPDVFFIDKTLFIKDFIEKGSQVNIILRPRRFGKSLNVSMLKSFLTLGADFYKFDRFAIGKEKEFVEEHCGQYPVVHLDLKERKGETWDKMYSRIWDAVREMVEPHQSDLMEDIAKFDPSELNFQRISPPKRLDFILQWLIKSLYKKHKKKVILLIDEYDAPLNHAFRKGYYEKASEFFGAFYSDALKGNSALEKACLMGIVEVRGAGIVSGLNNIDTYSVSDEDYSTYFGFTIDEVSEALDHDPEKIKKILEWYDGYQIGSHKMLNPWSFCNYLKRNVIAPYWTESADAETISTVLGAHMNELFQDAIILLYSGAKFKIPALVSHVKYASKDWKNESIWHFMVHTGYLAYEHSPQIMHKSSVQTSEILDYLSQSKRWGYVWIPNCEVYQHWQENMEDSLKKRI